jgi:hypothetical protein
MPADPEQTARLRALHDQYVWEVNAAVAEGRQDLIEMYCADYVEEAVQIMAAGWPAGTACPRDHCAACERPLRPPPPRRDGWRRLLSRSWGRRA